MTFQSNYKFNKFTTTAHKRNIPTPAVVAHLPQDPRDTNRFVPMVSFQTFESSIVNICADQTEVSGIYQNTACVSLAALFRPFSANSGSSTIGYLPHYQSPDSILPTGIINTTNSGATFYSRFYGTITNETLNPYKQNNDFEWCTYGATYSGIHLQKNNGGKMTEARGIALCARQVMEGWGVGLNLAPVPNVYGDNLQEEPSGGWHPNYLKDSRLWKVGSFETIWDDIRGVWMSPGMVLTGRLHERLGTGIEGMASGAIMNIISSTSNGQIIETSYRVRVYNPFGIILGGGTTINVGYSPILGKLVLQSADCS